MKKIIYILSALILLATTSCSLDEQSYVDVDKNKFMNNAKEADLVLLGVYRNLVNEGLYAYNLSMVFDLTNDLAQCEGNSTANFREIPTNYFNKSNKQVEDTWRQLYAAIYMANDFIATLNTKKEAYTEEDREKAEIFIAEAKTLRALFYFELVRWYGNVTLVLTPEDADKKPEEFVQITPAQAYVQIEQDLTEAALVLPWATDANRPFRMSKGSAYGLLAKVYATWAGYPVHDQSKWTKAAETAAIVITSGKHELNPDFEEVWKNTCNSKWEPKESLIEVSFYAQAYTGNSNLDPMGRIGKWNGVQAKNGYEQGNNAGNVKVVYSFANKWQNQITADTTNDLPEDLRYGISIANYKFDIPTGGTKVEKIFYSKDPMNPKTTELQNWTPRKWTTEYVEKANVIVSNDLSNINWYILRYADLLLIYAEALNETKGGPTTEALEAINQVRRRGYGLPISTAAVGIDLPALDQDGFRQAIRDERAYELCFEGHRRQDLIRWGIYQQTIQTTNTWLQNWWVPTDKNPEANYPAYRYTIAGKHELFPIPQREMDLMPQFRQNPKW